MYCTFEGVMLKLKEDLYDETELVDAVTDTSPEVISWVDNACRRSTGFTELDLVGEDSIIRLAANCYAACRLMSEVLEGHDIKKESLARYRCNEAKEAIRMWCALHDIVPTFDDVFVPSAATSITQTEVGIEFANAYGEDSVCIG